MSGTKSDDEWRKKLTPAEYQVLRESGTEPPFSGEFASFDENGVYKCKGCGHALFDSSQKFNSGCGWPSFDNELNNANIKQVRDTSHGMIRTEVRCSHCDSHLGHIFDDGPTNTGLRYCINSICLTFDAKK